MLNIILDLDNTIISSLSRDEERRKHASKFHNFIWEDMDGQFKVFERPNLQEFLNFLFSNFNVSIWTAASKNYALFIIDKFILIDPKRKIQNIFFSYHCRESFKETGHQKKLSILWKLYQLDIYNRDNTYIIDDHINVYLTQPSRCINIYPFEFQNKTSSHDIELLDNLLPYLEKILHNYKK